MVKVFISYSHKDEDYINNYISHLSPLIRNGKIECWHDRKLNASDEFLGKIDYILYDSEIICLMISSNYLASDSCMNEKDEAIKLFKEKSVKVIPIILTPCAWTNISDISSLLALPKDGKAISQFNDENEGWLEVVTLLDELIDKMMYIKNMKFKNNFKSFLNSTDILSKAHFNKENLNLSDIYIPSELKIYTEDEVSNKYNSEKLILNLLNYPNIIIAGDNQSGKTTLCKMLCRRYRELGLIPVYIVDEDRYLGNPENKIINSLKEQYENFEYSELDKDTIIPILDNFHLAKHQEKYIEFLNNFKNKVLIVDNIYGLNLRNQNLIKKYQKFKIREFTALERDKLIRKWIEVTENDKIEINPNYLNQSLDEKTEMVEQSLGKVLGKGIMPSYPFFILSLLAAHDINQPLSQDITSQGYCYQALMFLYLSKQGVKGNEIDTYLNFLTELAKFIYNTNKFYLTNEEYEEFIKSYNLEFNLTVDLSVLMTILRKSNICEFNSYNHFEFKYEYIFYFFVAKYIAENIADEENLIDKLISNLHKDENAYITVFITHHTKSDILLNKLTNNCNKLFSEYSECRLDREEVSFFDDNEDKIVQAVLPSFEYNSDEEREQKLIAKSNNEELDSDYEIVETEESSEINKDDESGKKDVLKELDINLRLSIKSVEVLGLIIRNRAGSLPLSKLNYLYEIGQNLQLRVLSSFIELIKDKEVEEQNVEFIVDRIKIINEKRESEDKKLLDSEKIKNFAKDIYWHLNFGVLHGLITKTIHSLGSNSLIKVSREISDKTSTPSSYIIYEGINMWYAKTLSVDTIASKLEGKDFSKIARKLLLYKVVEHVRYHKIEYKKMIEIEQKLHLSSQKLIVEMNKKD